MSSMKMLKEYRSTLMKTLCSSEDIVKLVKDVSTTPSVPDKTLIYDYIQPYPFIPDPEEKAKTYICARITVPKVINKTYKYISLTLFVFTHYSLMRATDGLRIDLLCDAIDTLMNGSVEYGLGRVELCEVDDIHPAKDYYGLVLRYEVTDWNRAVMK